ncbi:MGMT family protein [Oceanotoga sp. DSM 15011]|uniref:MGMT family protein n=1 Tax=unclassified Oceanotoga TaxID=2618448 RepID=UPI0021F47D97|nr:MULTISPECIES: MGMT family protein [unclassified Oceanotoga]MDN5342743.1 hypothetical protein [Oceanotoga sp.]UYO99212.1 MGMT family protein [Oceanotoga sp. DSM 15011]
MKNKKLTLNEKLNSSDCVNKIVIIEDKKLAKRYGGNKMLIATPIEYDKVMKKIPEGKLTTSVHIREYLAKKNNVDYTCHLTAGIFINLVARASEERKEEKTPFWRTLKKDGELNLKYPGGIDKQRELLEKEGHEIIMKGKKMFVNNYEKALFELK